MLEELPHDGSHRDGLGEPRDSRTKAAHPTDGEVNGRSHLRCPIQRIDDRWVGQSIGLEHDASRRTTLTLGVDPFNESRPQRGRRHQQTTERTLLGEPGQEVEQVTNIGPDLFVCCEQTDIFIDACRL